MRKNDRHLRREVLDRLLIVNERHLRRVLTEFLPHYNTARHPSLGQLTPAQADSWPPEPVNLANHRMRPKQILGGLTREYYIAALPPHVATEKRRSPPKSYFRAAQVLEPHRSSLQLTGHADFWHPTGRRGRGRQHLPVGCRLSPGWQGCPQPTPPGSRTAAASSPPPSPTGSVALWPGSARRPNHRSPARISSSSSRCRPPSTGRQRPRTLDSARSS
jgi:hypothetical protein